MQPRLKSVDSSAEFYRFGPTSSVGKLMRAFLELDLETKQLRIAAACETDPKPMRVHHGIVSRYPVDPKTDAVELVRMVNRGDLDDLFERILTGASVEWDGRNYVATLTDNATEAECELAERLQEFGEVYAVQEPWRAENWFQDVTAAELGITAETTDAELREIVQAEEATAARDGVTLMETMNYLEQVRDNLSRA